MKVLWALISENSIVNGRSNDVSLVEIIGELTIPAQPSQQAEPPGQAPNSHFNSWMSILFARSDPQVSEIGRSQVAMVTPSGTEAAFLDINVDLTQHLRSRPVETYKATGLYHPDFFIAFQADLESHERRDGYVISEQGKPPDFVLEIASRCSEDQDDTVKRDFYEALGVPEYWRFDPTGEYNQALLAADQLVDGKYRPMPVHRLGDEVWQGCGIRLNLYIRWERGHLRWIDPTTMSHILTFEDKRELAKAERGRAAAAKTRAAAAESPIRELRERC